MSIDKSTDAQTSMPLVGVIGGIGPRASAAFVAGVYGHADAADEQEMPRLVLWSDPSFPDRTRELRAGNGPELARRLGHAAEGLVALGVGEILVCCFTLHSVVGLLPRELTDRIVSLVDLTFDALDEVDEPHLLLCTTGSRELEVFKRHDAWPDSGSRLILPSRKDQERVHELIYRLKLGANVGAIAKEIQLLLDAHGVERFVAGCTELHLLADAFPAESKMRIDALDVARTRILAGLPLHPVASVKPVR